MSSGFWAIGLALLMEPTVGDWRVIPDDPGNAVLAVETSDLSGPPERRLVATVAINHGALDQGLYLSSQIAIDCDQRQVTLISAEVKRLNGEVLKSLDPDELESTTASATDASPSAVAMACEGVPMTTPSFRTDVAFITWAVEQLRAR